MWNKIMNVLTSCAVNKSVFCWWCTTDEAKYYGTLKTRYNIKLYKAKINQFYTNLRWPRVYEKKGILFLNFHFYFALIIQSPYSNPVSVDIVLHTWIEVFRLVLDIFSSVSSTSLLTSVNTSSIVCISFLRNKSWTYLRITVNVICHQICMVFYDEKRVAISNLFRYCFFLYFVDCIYCYSSCLCCFFYKIQ